MILMVLCFAGLYRLVHSRIGRLCLSLQQNEELASSIGVNVACLRVIAYAISSFLGGAGGRDLRGDLRSRSIRRASPSPIRSISC